MLRHLRGFAVWVAICASVYAGPKGTISVPRAGTVTIDGDFSDWPLANYRSIAQQPEFPGAQGVGVPTNANGDHLVWDVSRVGPFNGTDLDIWEPDSPSEFGSSVCTYRTTSDFCMCWACSSMMS